MIEVTDKRLVDSVKVGDLIIGDTFVISGEVYIRTNGEHSADGLPCVVLNTEHSGKTIQFHPNLPVQQVSLHIEILNL